MGVTTLRVHNLGDFLVCQTAGMVSCVAPPRYISFTMGVPKPGGYRWRSHQSPHRAAVIHGGAYMEGVLTEHARNRVHHTSDHTLAPSKGGGGEARHWHTMTQSVLFLVRPSRRFPSVGVSQCRRPATRDCTVRSHSRQYNTVIVWPRYPAHRHASKWHRAKQYSRRAKSKKKRPDDVQGCHAYVQLPPSEREKNCVAATVCTALPRSDGVCFVFHQLVPFFLSVLISYDFTFATSVRTNIQINMHHPQSK